MAMAALHVRDASMFFLWSVSDNTQLGIAGGVFHWVVGCTR